MIIREKKVDVKQESFKILANLSDMENILYQSQFSGH